MEQVLEDGRTIEITKLERKGKFCFGFKWDGKYKSLRAFKDWLQETYPTKEDLVEMDIRKGGVTHQHGTLLGQRVNGKWGEQYLGKNNWVVWEITGGYVEFVEFVVLSNKAVEANFHIQQERIPDPPTSTMKKSNSDYEWFHGVAGEIGHSTYTYLVAYPRTGDEVLEVGAYIKAFLTKYKPLDISRLYISRSGKYIRFDNVPLLWGYYMVIPVEPNHPYWETSQTKYQPIEDFLQNLGLEFKLSPEQFDRGPADLLCKN